mmetsp:Transcript_34283/g.66384  ORF Transcript_34283/g.66384 Transcript_34283/m.66384 type:complete len:471 (+) Transcript_34283:3-1415(+)
MASPKGKAAQVLGDDEQHSQPQPAVKLFPPTKTDNVETASSLEQRRLERLCTDLLTNRGIEVSPIQLLRNFHQSYLVHGLTHLPGGYSSLDASRPWILFWILHSLELLGALDKLPSDEDAKRVYSFLDRCQAPSGGFGGGPGQRAHLAPTYAAIMSLVILGSENGFKIVNRQKMYEFLMSVKVKSGVLRGGFSVTVGGEVDTRGTYTSLAVASILNIITPELVDGVAEFVARNQTYEGGIGAEPGNEAHGGYAYCGLAALRIINRTDAIDLPALLRWATQRQMSVEGGFQGRTNKLVDSCYSWWVGGIFPLLNPVLPQANTMTNTTTGVTKNVEGRGREELGSERKSGARGEGDSKSEFGSLFHVGKLQEYILYCCQAKSGGLRDKPGKRPDYYHTCYALSGLSMAQHERDAEGKTVGNPQNLLRRTDPTYNASPGRVERAMGFFGRLSLPTVSASTPMNEEDERPEGTK